MITWRGFFYLLFIILVYIVLAYTGYDLLVFLFVLLIILPLLSAAQLAWACRSLEISQNVHPSPLERTGRTHLSLVFRQRGWQAQGLIDFSICFPGKKARQTYVRRQAILLPGLELKRKYAIECPHHGQYQLGISRMRARDQFGLFYLPVRLSRTWRRDLCQLTVWPRPLKLEQLQNLASLLKIHPQQISPRFGDEVDAVANLRGYQPGDSMRRVHWKLTARLNETMIKEFEKPLQQETILLLDLPPVRTELPEIDFLDYFTDCAAELARQALMTGSRLYSVWYDREDRQAVECENSLDLARVLWQLTSLRYTSDWPLRQVVLEEKRRNHAHWTLLLLTTDLTSEMADQLAELQSNNHQTCLIIIPASAEMQPENRLLTYLQDNEVTVLVLPDKPQELAELPGVQLLKGKKKRQRELFSNVTDDMIDADKGGSR
jgi:uncharacterized protein (DUF58 family)